MRLFISTALIIVISGCVSSPTIDEAVLAPSNRLLTFQTQDIGRDATVTVVREAAFQAGHCFFGIYIDGMLVARLDNNEKANFFVKPGRRLVGVGSDPLGEGNCSGNSDYKREVATWVQIGENQTFRIAFQPMLDVRPSSY